MGGCVPCAEIPRVPRNSTSGEPSLSDITTGAARRATACTMHSPQAVATLGMGPDPHAASLPSSPGVARRARRGRAKGGHTVGKSPNGKAPLASNGHRLSVEETRVLHCLMRHPHRPVSARQLTEEALGALYDPASRRADQLVFQLRKKLGPTVITARPGQGYVYEGE